MEVPSIFVTVTFTVPAAWAGAVTVICVEVLVTIVAALPPKETPVAAARPVPVMVTVLPPAVVPDVGDRVVSTGGLT